VQSNRKLNNVFLHVLDSRHKKNEGHMCPKVKKKGVKIVIDCEGWIGVDVCVRMCLCMCEGMKV
jgi:hypothetical protein